MLEVYKDKQSLFYQQINNSVVNKKISHAYLIETNGYEDSDILILDLVKEIFKLSVSSDDEYLNIKTLIDNNTFSDFIIIEPINNTIKKEQILEVKEKFMTTSTYNRPRIYLIKEADKLNKYAANSLLKFLEEPEGNIIAILSSENRYKVMDTIRSRCQLYSLLGNKSEIESENIETINKIIETLEKYKEKSIAYLSIVLENDIKDKTVWLDVFKNMITIYDKALRQKEKIMDSNDSIIGIIVDNNSTNQIIDKINILFTTLNNLEYNLNINMMLDKFIIDFTGGLVK